MNRDLTEKLTSPKLVNKFPTFYGTRRFITAFTTARHLSLSWVRSIQWVPPSHFANIHFNIIIPSTSGSSMHLSPYILHALTISTSFDHPNDICWGVQSINQLVMQSSPLPCYLVPLGPKYPPQHFILEIPQSTFLPQCVQPSFTPIQNNR